MAPGNLLHRRLLLVCTVASCPALAPGFVSGWAPSVPRGRFARQRSLVAGGSQFTGGVEHRQDGGGFVHSANDTTLRVPWLPRPSQFSNPDEVMAQAKHSLVMMRHGESAFNKHHVFTGWCDVPLTAVGRQEAREAGEILGARGLEFDVVFCSVLQRSTVTCSLALEACGQTWVDVRPRWQLNERHYGALQGLSKARIEEEYGSDLVSGWRQGYHVRPPPMGHDHPHWALMAQDRRYRDLVDTDTIPVTESLADTAVRVMELWHGEIAPLIAEGKRVLVIAHRNSLRALIRNLEGLSDEQVAQMTIPTGAPFVYPLEEHLRPVGVPLSCENGNNDDPEKSAGCGFQGIFLSDDQCEKSYRRTIAQCLSDWDEDPAHPPEACLNLTPDECVLDF
uniref:Phosphoglycerate mutase n=1 Tax=Rhizochromulina marina TaxID=1034831 RepID=A0A7S2RJU0_9STRA|mmetsp:Transcript_17274/g.50372  ORF Transcript_17274/g.50372 Transcript_17274/m.50372 type:complete len:393 (+) Transcript_17274:101-1279(+)